MCFIRYLTWIVVATASIRRSILVVILCTSLAYLKFCRSHAVVGIRSGLLPESLGLRFNKMADASVPSAIDLTANHDAEIISLSVVFVTLSLLSVIARLVSKKIQHVTFSGEDILLVLSWVHISLLGEFGQVTRC